ncbi:MAG: TIGR04348 family glycosyltransferase, partial [Planctomycetales bacterium]|nr:TIGR04348 family glycosyltransferase [Planctomycetales bacterium]NIM07723.1 TIGR04348 family glycosyltransferase [Planctomycetales bacterium]NIN07226.1 TIGR04348 family glycosyltransferase [Planctomycetales bacterium]NIN76319.1 TIGR04348 family glycosyltransferase [Planctomycetales bacterium]NIO33524.1 TIGR04348 family glycosyltransferase [Planctomycetales bacterium]
TRYQSQACDLLVALHAKRSAQSVARYVSRQPASPCIVALTGTDLYRDIHRQAAARRSLAAATRLVLLQPDGIRHLPRGLRGKARVILQSAVRPRGKPRKLKTVFEVSVSGHLRAVKDPFRAARAARRLPAASCIRIIHIGAALSDTLRRQAEAEMQNNPRYRWLGELAPGAARRRVARSRLLVLSSKIEGGANVLAEALVAGVPVLSSRISGSLGMLGEDYDGYFPTGDTRRLARLLSDVERDGRFYRRLQEQCRQRAKQFTPAREKNSWKRLLAEIG